MDILDIENIQQKNLEIEILEKINNDPDQNKKWKIYEADYKINKNKSGKTLPPFENIIYRMDILNDNHISEIVLGKTTGINKDYLILFVYLINKENKLNKDSSCISYLTIKRKEWDKKTYNITGI